MTEIPNPPLLSLTPMAQITPFTYREGATLVYKIHQLQRWLLEVLMPWAENESQEVRDWLEAQIQVMLNIINQNKADWDQKFADLEEHISSLIAELNDSAVSGLIADTTSQTHTSLDSTSANLANDFNSKLGTAIRELVNHGVGVIDPLGQDLSYMTGQCYWLARPTGSSAWTQGFSVNEDTKEIYVAAYNYGSGIATPAQWVECRNYDGTLKWRTRDIPVTSTGAYSEGLPWFKDSNDQLCFILRIDVGDASSAGYVRIYNKDADVLSAKIPVAGNSKLFSDGTYFYTTTSSASRAQISAVYKYTLSSIIARTPELVFGQGLENFGSLRQDEKPQGFAVISGYFATASGKRNTDADGNGKLGIRYYAPSGNLVKSMSADRLDLRRAMSEEFTPGLIHPTGVNYENEGLYPLRDGRVMVMTMLYENAFITIHGSRERTKFKTVTPELRNDTLWATVEPNTAAGVSVFDPNQPIQYRRVGQLVYIRGAVKINLSSNPGSNITLFSLPNAYKPDRNYDFIMPSNGNSSWRGLVSTGANVQISRYNDGTITPETWLPVNFSFYMED